MMTKKIVALGLLIAIAGCAAVDDSKPQAVAKLTPTAGNTAAGFVKFMQKGDNIVVLAEVTGLRPNSKHGFHIHDKGDCSKPDGTGAGGHFNPDASAHGSHDGATRHAGDLPNLTADASGRARLRHEISGVRLDLGHYGIIGRGMIVHAAPDDYTSQPAGNAGARIACGVIHG